MKMINSCNSRMMAERGKREMVNGGVEIQILSQLTLNQYEPSYYSSYCYNVNC